MKSHHAVFALLSIAAASLMGCGSGGGSSEFVDSQGNLHGTLTIEALEAGYGGTFITALARKYEEHNPGVTVKESASPLSSQKTTAQMKSQQSDVDIFMTNGINFQDYIERDNSIEDITSVFDSAPKAGSKTENVTIRDKMIDEYVRFTNYDGKNYVMPWANGPCGFVANVEVLDLVFGKGQYTMPRTTGEMIEMMDAIKNTDKTVTIDGKKEKIYPLAWAGLASEYWTYPYEVWFAQYDGIENYNRFWRCEDSDGSYSYEAYLSDGRLKGLEGLESMLKDSNGYSYPGSITAGHTSSQMNFLLNRCAFMPNGDWIENEMKKNFPEGKDIKTIKTPIISSLGEKLGLTEASLRQIVSDIDLGKTGSEGVDTSVFSRVKEARRYIFNLGNTHQAFIPSFSKDKQIAKDFLRFLASDEAYLIFLEETGSFLPFEHTFSDEEKASMTSFGRQKLEIMESSTYLFYDLSDPIRYRAGLSEFVSTERPEISLALANNAKTAEQITTSEYNYVKSMWSSYISKVGS